MGHGMATNIRHKVPEAAQLIVYDVNADTVARILKENPGSNIRGASSPREIAEVAVGIDFMIWWCSVYR